MIREEDSTHSVFSEEEGGLLKVDSLPRQARQRSIRSSTADQELHSLGESRIDG